MYSKVQQDSRTRSGKFDMLRQTSGWWLAGCWKGLKSTMPILQNKILVPGMLLLALYWIVGAYAARQPWLETVRTLQTVADLVVLVAFTVVVWRAIRDGNPDDIGQFSLGIYLIALSGFGTGLWLLLYRLSGPIGGRAEWMIDSLLFGFVSGWLNVLGSTLLVTAPGALRDNVPPLQLILVGMVIGAGMLVILMVLLLQFDATWIAKWLHGIVP